MNEENDHQIPLQLPFASAFCSFMDPLASPNGSSGSHDLASPFWPFVDSKMTTYCDATSQYLTEGGCASVAGMQAVMGASDFQGSLHVGAGNPYMNEFVASSFQTDLSDAKMLDACQYQDLLRTAELWYNGQCDNTENKSQTSCDVKDIGLTTDVALLENYALAQNHASRTKEVNGNNVHVIQSHLKPSKATVCVDSSRSRRSVSRAGVNARDNVRVERRCRITKGIQDLGNLLPQSARNQLEAMDETIEYIKHLQLQLKELSQNRLKSEGDTDPLISLKGPNIHLPVQLFLEEFKDLFGRLLKENPTAGKKLLESHGLLMVPLDLAKALCQKE